jgi:GNAT superfamily N-acetyltransferase
MLCTLRAGGDDFRVRRAVADDVPALVALFGADPVSAGRGDSADGDLAHYRAAFAAIDADPGHLLTAVEDAAGGVVGTLQLTLLPGLARRGAWRAQLESVHVAERLRGRGLGSALVRWAIDEAARRGAGLVQLTSALERPDAHRLYERLGFTASHVGFKMVLEHGSPAER